MDGIPIGPKIPPFPAKFEVLVNPGGVRQILQVHPCDIVEYVGEEPVVDAILQWTQRAASDHWMLSPTQCIAAARVWRGTRMPLPECPPIVKTHSSQGYCFHRLPFDPEPLGDCPLFDEFVSRCSNGDALKAFIGSLFVEGANRQQYLWLYGEGRNGKSSLSRLLQRLLGPSYHSEDTNAAGNQFWTYGLLGKRLVVFNDTNSMKFTSSALCKAITGGDPVRIERKNKDPYSAELRCKLMFISNNKPQVDGDAANSRRCIFVGVGDFEGDEDPGYEDKLWAEAPAILAVCVAAYHRVCSNHEPIPIDASVQEDLIAAAEEDFEELFEKRFQETAEEEHMLTRGALKEIIRKYDPIRYGSNKGAETLRFTKYLERRGFTVRNIGVRGARRRVWYGLAARRPDLHEVSL